MKFLLINSVYFPHVTGGAPRSVQLLAEALLARGHQVSVACLTPQGPQRTALVNGVTVHYLPLRNLYWPFDGQKRPGAARLLWHLLDLLNPWAAWDLWRVLRAEKPDVVNTNMLMGFSVSALLAIKGQKRKAVHTLRDYYMLCPQVAMFRSGCNCSKVCLGCRPFRFVRARVSRFLDGLVAISSFVLQKHQSNRFEAAGAPARVIGNIVDLATDRRAGSVPSGPVRFGYLGRINESKGVLPMLEAFARFNQAYGGTLTVAGSGSLPLMSDLRRQFDGPAIRFVGWQAPELFFESVDVLICPSVYEEPLGRVVLEAYSFGKPVIAARRGGLTELVEEGVTGFTYSPDEPEGLATAMRAFLGQLSAYEKMSQSCLKKAQDFSASAIAQSFEEFCIELNRN
jgi:glycosyltransferase involved in cell wall biosynthesis